VSARAVNTGRSAAGTLSQRPGPRYSALARLLTSEIASGRYRVGDRIPTEAKLQQRFDVSRHTIREALRELKTQGLLTARAGIGTVVRAKAPGARLMMGVGTLRELIHFVEATRMRLIDRREVIADEALAQKLGARQGQQWIEATVLRFLPDERTPVAAMSIYLRPEHADVLGMIDRSKQPVFNLLERHHGVRIAEVRQQIVAVTLGKPAARALVARAGSPALEITRHYLDAQDRVTLVSVGQYPSDRFSHSTKFRVQSE
jgi:DNA-binding GntR family transcriptional regulator